jgi:hypothetical protein
MDHDIHSSILARLGIGALITSIRASEFSGDAQNSPIIFVKLKCACVLYVT